MRRSARQIPATRRPGQDLGRGRRRIIQRVFSMKRAVLRAVLLALPLIIRSAARRHAMVRRTLSKGHCVIQLRLRDSSVSRSLTFHNGTVRAAWGVHSKPDAEMVFASVATALAMLKPNPDYAVVIDALKNFKATAGGSDPHLVWFGQLMHTI